MHNFQRDGHMQTAVPKDALRTSRTVSRPTGRASRPSGAFVRTLAPRRWALRVRPASFADHYSQARLFYVSQTEPEQNHIVAALVFELSKVEAPAIRERMSATW